MALALEKQGNISTIYLFSVSWDLVVEQVDVVYLLRKNFKSPIYLTFFHRVALAGAKRPATDVSNPPGYYTLFVSYAWNEVIKSANLLQLGEKSLVDLMKLYSLLSII